MLWAKVANESWERTGDEDCFIREANAVVARKGERKRLVRANTTPSMAASGGFAAANLVS
jgi:hypothetical protein